MIKSVEAVVFNWALLLFVARFNPLMIAYLTPTSDHDSFLHTLPKEKNILFLF